MPQWSYDPKLNRYRDVLGRFVAHEQVIAWAYSYASTSGSVVASLGSQVATGLLRVGDWQGVMRDEVKRQFINQYIAGRGGLSQMTQRDWGALGRMLKEQYHHLDGFAADIAAGKLSEAQIRARAQMYIDAGHLAFERGRAEAFGMPTLPAYPGDGQTVCLTHCHCNWMIDEVKDADGLVVGWEALWRLNPADHCGDCPTNAVLWAPLWVPAGMTPAEAEAWREVERQKMLDVRA